MTKNKKGTYKVTVLPKATREQALEKDPGIAWSRDEAHDTDINNEFKQGVCNLNYEGRR